MSPDGDLATKIANARAHLLVARQAENAIQQLYWGGELDYLLDQWEPEQGT